jgi:hypothetical protein
MRLSHIYHIFLNPVFACIDQWCLKCLSHHLAAYNIQPYIPPTVVLDKLIVYSLEMIPFRSSCIQDNKKSSRCVLSRR